MKKVKKLKDNKYLSTEIIVHNNKLLSTILTETENEIEQGNWTPTLLNCNYEAPTCVGKYTKIGKMVTVWFHIRATITSLINGGSASIAGLPYKPMWPQGAGNVSVCLVTDTDYVPPLYVNNDGDGKGTGTLDLVNNTNGSTNVRWKVQNGGWLAGTATYFID